MTVIFSSSNESLHGANNKTIGTLLPRATMFNGNKEINGKYLSIEKYRDYANKYAWYSGNLIGVHDTFVNDGFPAEITNTFTDMLISESVDLNIEDKIFKNTNSVSYMTQNLSIFGECFLGIDILENNEFSLFTISPMYILNFEENKNISYYRKYKKATTNIAASAELIEVSVENGGYNKNIYNVSIDSNGDITKKELIFEIANENITQLPIVKVLNNAFGESDYQNVRQLFLGKVFYHTQAMEETRVAKLKAFVDRSMVRRTDDGDAVADVDTSVFFIGSLDVEKKPFYVQGDLRLSIYTEKEEYIKSLILNQVGLSSEILNPVSAKSSTQKTAKEIQKSISKTEQTLKRKKQHISFGLQQLLKTLPDKILNDDIISDFISNILNDTGLATKEEQSELFGKKLRDKLISLETAVSKENPNMTKDEVMEEVIKIKIDNGDIDALNQLEIEKAQVLGLL